MRLNQWVQGGLVLVLMGLVVLAVPDLGYANTGEDGNAGGGQGEDENYVNIEEAMREYNARYKYFKAIDHNGDQKIDSTEVDRAPYVMWPDCIDPMHQKLDASKPDDDTYRSTMHDKHQAVFVVAAMVDTFYAKNFGSGASAHALYTKFVKVEGESTSNPNNSYEESDFPLTWVSGSPTEVVPKSRTAG